MTDALAWYYVLVLTVTVGALFWNNISDDDGEA